MQAEQNESNSCKSHYVATIISAIRNFFSLQGKQKQMFMKLCLKENGVRSRGFQGKVYLSPGPVQKYLSLQ